MRNSAVVWPSNTDSSTTDSGEVDKLSVVKSFSNYLDRRGKTCSNRLAAKHQIELLGFDDAWWPQSNLDLAGPARSAHGTDLRQPLLRALEANTMGADTASWRRHSFGWTAQPRRRPAQPRQGIEAAKHPHLSHVGLGCERPAPDLAIVQLTSRRPMPFTMWTRMSRHASKLLAYRQGNWPWSCPSQASRLGRSIAARSLIMGQTKSIQCVSACVLMSRGLRS